MKDYRVRRNAALTLAKLGQPADEAIPALVEMLEEENRYNRFYAANALRQIDTPAARGGVDERAFHRTMVCHHNDGEPVLDFNTPTLLQPRQWFLSTRQQFGEPLTR